jgi:hypothetical protein
MKIPGIFLSYCEISHNTGVEQNVCYLRIIQKERLMKIKIKVKMKIKRFKA